jgi:hypothetical protein
MFKLFSKIKEMFSFKEQNALDLYLKSKNVKTSADVEYWMRQWDKSNKAAFF